MLWDANGDSDFDSDEEESTESLLRRIEAELPGRTHCRGGWGLGEDGHIAFEEGAEQLSIGLRESMHGDSAYEVQYHPGHLQKPTRPAN